MHSEAIAEKIITNFGPAAIISMRHDLLQPWLEIHSDLLLPVAFFLRDTPGLYFDFLACISGIDDPALNRMGVVYHIYSIPCHHRLTLKIWAARDQEPTFPSLTQVWRAAEWHEREIYDLFGIHFTDHPDLRRILLPEDWVGYPLRKDYKERESYHDIPTQSE